MKSKLSSIDDEVLDVLSKKYNIPKYALKEIIHHPFKLLRRFQKNGDMFNIHLKGFGKFIVSDKCRNYNKKKKELNEVNNKVKTENILRFDYD